MCWCPCCCWAWLFPEPWAKWFIIVVSILFIWSGLAILISFIVGSSIEFVQISPELVNILRGFGIGGGLGVMLFGVFGILAACWNNIWRKVFIVVFQIGLYALFLVIVAFVLAAVILVFSSLGSMIESSTFTWNTDDSLLNVIDMYNGLLNK